MNKWWREVWVKTTGKVKEGKRGMNPAHLHPLRSLLLPCPSRSCQGRENGHSPEVMEGAAGEERAGQASDIEFLGSPESQPTLSGIMTQSKTFCQFWQRSLCSPGSPVCCGGPAP